MDQPESKSPGGSAVPGAVAFAAVVAMVAALAATGRLWWCKHGDAAIYVNEAWNSSHTSQHFLDPYTFTHVLHGVLFFWIAQLLFGEGRRRWALTAAVVAECAWEILENSNFVIEKYRENTASLDYFGDSIANSFGDVIACIVGFVVATRLGWWRSLVFFLAVEVLLLIWIKDGLLLNIVMLLYPLESVKQWQVGG
jgi:hypothetical protein